MAKPARIGSDEPSCLARRAPPCLLALSDGVVPSCTVRAFDASTRFQLSGTPPGRRRTPRFDRTSALSNADSDPRELASGADVRRLDGIGDVDRAVDAGLAGGTGPACAARRHTRAAGFGLRGAPIAEACGSTWRRPPSATLAGPGAYSASLAMPPSSRGPAGQRSPASKPRRGERW